MKHILILILVITYGVILLSCSSAKVKDEHNQKNIINQEYIKEAELKHYPKLKQQPDLTGILSLNPNIEQISFVATVNELGKTTDISYCSLKDEKMCKPYETFISNIEFTPAYDMETEKNVKSEIYIFITLKNNQKEITILTNSATEKESFSVVMGSLDKSDIAKIVINRNAVKYMKCYNDAVLNQPELTGKIVVNFIISSEGRIDKASIKRSSINNKTMEECVRNVFSKMLFPDPKGGGIVIVTQPLIFKNSLKF